MGWDAIEREAVPDVVQLCGPLIIRIGGRRLEDGLRGARMRALFAYLVRHRGRPVTRAELIEAIWGDAMPRSPEATLSTALARLRGALGADLVSGREHLTLQLPEGTLVDVETAMRAVEEAEDALAAGAADDALRAARGGHEIASRPLLPGLRLQWVDEWRDDLTQLEVRLLEATARAALAAGGPHLAHAERTARTLVEREPYRESGYGVLMQCLARAGNHAEASRTFHRLRQFLLDELGTSPSPLLTELHDRLLHEAAGGVSEPPAAPRPSPQRDHGDGRDATGAVAAPPIGNPADDSAFVGRDRQLSRLAALWQQARDGRRVLASVAGEAGIGKTRLAGEFAHSVVAGGGTVLYGRCEEDAVVPYQSFVKALRYHLARVRGVGAMVPAAAPLEPLVPELRDPALGARPPAAAPAGADAYALFEAFNALLEWVSSRAPVLLVLDDLHWASRDEVLLLRHLLDHPHDAPLMLLVTYRDTDLEPGHPLAAMLADVRRHHPTARLQLTGFARAEIERLVADRLARPFTGEFVAALHHQTGGNPLFMRETLRSIAESSTDDATLASLDGIGVPEGVVEVIGRRLGRLPDEVADTLAAAAVAGREFDLDIVAAALHLDPDHALDRLEASMAAGLVCEVADNVDRFAFTHAVIRQALRTQMTASRRRRLERRVGAALQEHAG